MHLRPTTRRFCVALAAVTAVLLAAVPAAGRRPDRAAAGCPAGLAVAGRVGGAVLCSHGDDHHLHLHDGEQVAGSRTDGEESTARNRVAGGEAPAGTAGPIPSADPRCLGDGSDGPRVELLYVHAAGSPDRSATLAGDLRRWAGQVEWTVTASAARAGGTRVVRWRTESAADGCRIRIGRVALDGAALEDFNRMVEALAAHGYGRSDRRYLVFADAEVMCGMATLSVDDRPGPGNQANVGTGYARVDRPCWNSGDHGTYSVAAHELVHTLGAVQRSAPHATDGYHCSDEWDALCYVDGAGVSTTVACRDADGATSGEGDGNNRLLDCGGDDYFNPDPPPGSYLDTHWNTADSVYLTGGDGSGTAPSVPDDPHGRPMRWPAGDLGGAHRPLLPGAYGWEACDLPVRVWLADETATDGGLLGSGSDGPLPDLVEAAAGTVNHAVGREVVRVEDSRWDGRAPEDGSAVIAWGATRTGPTHLRIRAGDARIRSGTVTLDRPELTARSEAGQQTLVLQAMAQLLGLGRVGGTTDLMSPYPPGDADRTVALAALRHLYGQGCAVDPRLHDTASGHPSQRVPAGERRRLDLAAQVRTPAQAALSLAGWLRAHHGDGQAGRAVVCRDDVFADCLAGSALAGTTGPVLLVPGGPDGDLPDRVGSELARSVAAGGEVFVLGGPVAVSDRVVTGLRRRLPGRTVSRIWGQDRHGTAAAVARQVVGESGASRVLLARSDDPADAIAAGAAAARLGVPVLLTPTGRPAPTSLEAVDELGLRTVLALGGEAAISEAVVDTFRARAGSAQRIAGRTRSETSVAVARTPALWDRAAVTSSGSVVALNGWDDHAWALALAAAPVAATLQAPVVFTGRDGLPGAAPSGAWPGEVGSWIRDLPVRTGGSGPTVISVFIGAGNWATPAVADAFHGAVLPGFDGNVDLTR